MKTFLIAFCLVAMSAAAWADNAVFREVKGKVEYQTKGEAWLPAKVGLEVPAGTSISTGFKSTAAIEVLGSVVFVKPLTRIVLEDLVRNSVGTTTKLTLLAGKVKAEVKPSSATAVTDFDVKGPTATASVRGTGFEFDGVSLLVNHGEVDFSNKWQVSRSVHGGEFSSVGREGASVSAPIPVKPAEKQVITASGSAAEVDALFKDDSSTTAPAVPAQVDLSKVVQTFGDQLILTNGVAAVSEETKQVKDATQAVESSGGTANLSITIQ